MNAKGRVKEDGAFKFYEQESSRGDMSYHAYSLVEQRILS